MPEELWTEICDIVQKAMIKTILKKKKCNSSNGFNKENLTSHTQNLEIRQVQGWLVQSVSTSLGTEFLPSLGSATFKVLMLVLRLVPS